MPNTPYLERKLVNAEFIITDEQIKIWSDDACTSYINVSVPKELITLEEINEAVKEIRKICRSNKTKLVNQKKFKEGLEKHYDQYVAELEENQKRYADMKRLALQIQERGLHYGTTDDEVLREMTQIRFQYEKALYRNTSYSYILESWKKLCELRSMLSSNSGDTYAQLSL